MSASCLALLFAVAVTVHDFEEALFLPRWIGTRLKLPFDPHPAAYWVGTTLASILVWIAALGVVFRPHAPAFHFALSGFALVMAVNAFVPHLAISLFKRSYSPGTATAVLFNLPLGILVIQTGRTAALVPPSSFWTQTSLYAILLIVVSLGSLYAMLAILRRSA